jgi:hypothetical protein
MVLRAGRFPLALIYALMYNSNLLMSSYRNALTDAREELRRLKVLRLEAEARITRLERTIAGLAALCGEPDVTPEGLTDAIRGILIDAQADLSPIAIRNSLQQTGFDLGRYENPLAVIHTTLKRLAEQGQVMPCAVGGSVTYKWKRPDPKAGTDALRFLDNFVKKRA